MIIKTITEQKILGFLSIISLDVHTKVLIAKSVKDEYIFKVLGNDISPDWVTDNPIIAGSIIAADVAPANKEYSIKSFILKKLLFITDIPSSCISSDIINTKKYITRNIHIIIDM